MDLADYVAGLGLCIEAARPGRPPPLPPLGPEMDHAHDRCKAPLLQVLAPRIPAEAAPHFDAFQGERLVRQCVQREPFERHVSAWLGEGVMLGGEDASGRHVHHQHHPATAHWIEPGGRVGWLRLRSPAPVRAFASPGRLEVEVQTGVGWLREAEVSVEIEMRTTAAPTVGDGRLRLALPSGEGDRELQIEGTAIDAAGLIAAAPGADPARRISRRVFPPGGAPVRVDLVVSVEGAPTPPATR
jgi:hypothetical protein